MGSICCFDISHNDNPPSFHQAYDAGFVLAIVKATQGVTFVDPKFHDYITRIKMVDGMLAGAYHFGDGSDPVAQADHFVAWAGDIPLLVLDWETNPHGPSMTMAQAERFVQRVKYVKGRYPMIYGSNLLKDADNPVPRTSALASCELWLAQYSMQPDLPPAWAVYRLWQFTGDGDGPEPHDVPGIGQNVDISRFPGSPDDLRRWYGGLK